MKIHDRESVQPNERTAVAAQNIALPNNQERSDVLCGESIKKQGSGIVMRRKQPDQGNTREKSQDCGDQAIF